MQEYNEAVKIATEVLDIHPSCYEALHARAKAHHANGDLQLAVNDLTAAVRLAPDNRELHRILINLKQEIVTKTKSGEKDKPVQSLINDSHDSSSGVSSNLEIAE